MESTSKIRIARGRVRSKEGRRRSKSGSVPQRATTTAGTGFLAQHYWPVMESMPGIIADQKKIEREFFTSLSYLTAVYGFTPVDTTGYPYPYNITCVYQEIKKRLAADDVYTIIALNDDSQVCLATLKDAGNGRLMYYVPLKPLFNVLRDRRERRRRGLFLSLYHYLFAILRLPHYQDGGFMDGAYDYLDCCFDEETDEDGNPVKEFDEAQGHVRIARHFGDRLKKTCGNKCHLEQWEKRIRQFKPKDDLDILLLDLSRHAQKFQHMFPKINFDDNAPLGIVEPQLEERSDISYMFSFWWTGECCYGDSILRDANEHLMNSDIIEPLMACQVFDKPQAGKHLDIATMEELQDLIEKFCNVLIRFDEKYNGRI